MDILRRAHMSKQAHSPVRPRSTPVSTVTTTQGPTRPVPASLILSRKPDNRFIRHGTQPRAKYLDRTQYKLCKIDPGFQAALRSRVTNAARWQAFIHDRPFFLGADCKRCPSRRRRVYNGACYDCMLNRNRDDFQLIRKGVSPPANNSRDGWLARNEERTREKCGEFMRYEVGRFMADQFPTGRVRLYAPHIHMNTPDLQRDVPAQRLHQLADVDPDFLTLLKRLGWAR